MPKSLLTSYEGVYKESSFNLLSRMQKINHSFFNQISKVYFSVLKWEKCILYFLNLIDLEIVKRLKEFDHNIHC